MSLLSFKLGMKQSLAVSAHKGTQVTHWEATSKYTGTLSADGQTLTGGWRPNPGAPMSEGSAYDAVMTRRPDSRH